MTNVVNLAEWRRYEPPACGCARHELDALADRLRTRLEATAGELLVPREHLDQVLNDLRATTDRLLPPKKGARP